MEAELSKHELLMYECKKFIRENEISCGYQTDRVIENAYDFIRLICEIVGYYDGDKGIQPQTCDHSCAVLTPQDWATRDVPE